MQAPPPPPSHGIPPIFTLFRGFQGWRVGLESHQAAVRYGWLTASWLAAPSPLLRIDIIWDSQGVVEVALRQQLDLQHL